jgi:hypothetical protein
MIKSLGALAPAAIVLYVILLNFSTNISTLECPGALSSKQGELPATVYLKIERYGWWVVWAESDGNVTLEIPNQWID